MSAYKKAVLAVARRTESARRCRRPSGLSLETPLTFHCLLALGAELQPAKSDEPGQPVCLSVAYRPARLRAKPTGLPERCSPADTSIILTLIARFVNPPRGRFSPVRWRKRPAMSRRAGADTIGHRRHAPEDPAAQPRLPLTPGSDPTHTFCGRAVFSGKQYGGPISRAILRATASARALPACDRVGWARRPRRPPARATTRRAASRNP